MENETKNSTVNANKSNPPTEVKSIDPTQKIETKAYVPTYKIKPELKQAVLKAVGDRPFNEIAGLMNAIDVEVMDHQTLSQIVNALGQFPYIRVEKIIKNIQNFVTAVVED